MSVDLRARESWANSQRCTLDFDHWLPLAAQVADLPSRTEGILGARAGRNQTGAIDGDRKDP
jgi:hypothetical protein